MSLCSWARWSAMLMFSVHNTLNYPVTTILKFWSLLSDNCPANKTAIYKLMKWFKTASKNSLLCIVFTATKQSKRSHGAIFISNQQEIKILSNYVKLICIALRLLVNENLKRCCFILRKILRFVLSFSIDNLSITTTNKQC